MKKITFYLGCIFLLGILIQAKNAQAAEINLADLQKAAEQGDSVAQYNLGRLYADGVSVPQHDRNAVEWWQKAANQGQVNAQAGLGMMYASGRGVPKDTQMALEWFR